MGLRSITHIHQMHELGSENVVCSFYRHWNGNPACHGNDLASWLRGKRLVEGKGADFVIGRDFNRAGTMAVPLMMYIQAIESCEIVQYNSDLFQEYEYRITFDNQFHIECLNVATGKSLKMPAHGFDGKMVEALIKNGNPEPKLQSKVK